MLEIEFDDGLEMLELKDAVMGQSIKTKIQTLYTEFQKERQNQKATYLLYKSRNKPKRLGSTVAP